MDHQSETKYGNHWYKPTDIVVNPLDRFADSYYNAVVEIMWTGREAEWIYEETIDLFSLSFYLVEGFFDRGDSWEKGYAIMKHNGLEDWISP
jgi:hypothetical protein